MRIIVRAVGILLALRSMVLVCNLYRFPRKHRVSTQIMQKLVHVEKCVCFAEIIGFVTFFRGRRNLYRFSPKTLVFHAYRAKAGLCRKVCFLQKSQDLSHFSCQAQFHVEIKGFV